MNTCFAEDMKGHIKCVLRFWGSEDSEWLTNLFTVMTLNPGDEQIQEACCQALTNRISSNPSICNLIGEDHTYLLPIHITVFTCLNIHSKNVYVFQAACGAIYEMAIHSKNLQQYLIARHAHVPILREMTEYEDEMEIQAWGCRAMRALAYQNPLEKELMFKCDILTNLEEILQKFQDIHVLKECMGLLVILATDLEIMRRQCMNINIPKLILQIALQNKDCGELVELSMEGIAILSTSDEQPLLRLDCIRDIRHLMRHNKTNTGIQQTGCIIMQLMSACEWLYSDLQLSCEVVHVISDAMKRFDTKSLLKIEGCISLYLMFEKKRENSMALKRKAFEILIPDLLFDIIEHFRNDDDVTLLAQKCLMELTAERKLKNMAFHRACFLECVTSASYLLQLGADVDTYHNGESVLHMAVLKGNIELVELLLANNVSEAQAALALSIEERNWEITGLLLRYIGYEKESNSITWSALNIAEIKPAMLYPTLFNKKKTALKLTLSWTQCPTKRLTSRQNFGRPSRGSLSSYIESEKQSKGRPSVVKRTTSLSLNSKTDSFGRSVFSRSGAILPYHTSDPRLGRRMSEENYVVVTSLKRELHYPNHPNSLLTSEMSDERFGMGDLSHCSRCVTPDMIEKPRDALRKNLTQSPPHARRKGHIRQSSKVNKSPRSSLTPSQESHKTNIKTLDLSHNNITELTAFEDLRQEEIITHFLKDLENINLSNNRLTELSPSLCSKFQHLKTLDLSSNSLTKFPYEVFTNKLIESLDVSHNNIYEINKLHLHISNSVISLFLNDNNLSEFPVCLTTTFPHLTKLHMAHNHIREIPQVDIGFASLTDFILSHNSLSSIPQQFLQECPALEKLDVSHNHLMTLPSYTQEMLPRLSVVKLAHNKLEERRPFFIPQFLLSLPNLQVLDLSHNRIVQLPEPQYWSSKLLCELNLSNNRIRKLNLVITSPSILPQLSKLNLSHNNLEYLPSEICLLASLASLDISYNSITSLPDGIYRLKSLYEFKVDGLRLRHELINMDSPYQVVSYLASKSKSNVPYRKFNLLVVGSTGSGKTTLINQLTQIQKPASNLETAGVQINEWVLHSPKTNFLKNQPSVTLKVWDFCGQNDLHCTQKYFLFKTAIYLVVYDASEKMKGLEGIASWLLSIQASAPGSMTVLVGTHADKIPKDERKDYMESLEAKIRECLTGPGFPTICATAVVNGSRENNSIDNLREELYNIIVNISCKGQSIVDQRVPIGYVKLEQLLHEESIQKVKNHEPPILTKKDLWRLSLQNNIEFQYHEFEGALKFLKETGCLLNFKDSCHDLTNLYFINPQWLYDMLAKIVKTKQSFISSEGILPKVYAKHLFPKIISSWNLVGTFLRILRKFEIVLPITEEEYLVPCKMETEPNLSFAHQQYTNSQGVVIRRYVFPYVPNRFWSRLIARVLSAIQESRDMLFRADKPIRQNYWKNGIFVRWSSEKFLLIHHAIEDSNAFDVYTPNTKTGYAMFGVIVNLIDLLIEEWYPLLTEMIIEGSVYSVQRLCPCIRCTVWHKPHYFHLSECISASYESDIIECPNCGPIFISSIAPDVVFDDLDQELLYRDCPVDFSNTDKGCALVGSGAFASVYKANIDGSSIAIKVFEEPEGVSANRLLRQEVDIVRRISHPCLVSLIGVVLRPRLLLLEYAPLGNLAATLTSGRNLSRKLQQRISIQICTGLAYLHENKIAYRDLKPSNILVFSLSMRVLVNVKLSDYGISQEVSSAGLQAPKGTPLYQAPEVTLGEDNDYNVEVDVFSLGITLYQIITGGKMPYGDISFQNELDTAVLNNRPIKDIILYGAKPWPDMQNLIVQCLSANPGNRPSSEEICQEMRKPDFLCLEREISLCKGQTIDCLTIVKISNDYEGEVEIWVGSSESDSFSQLSWLSLTNMKKQNIQGTIVTNGRILCMATHENYVLVGTEDATILCFDCISKKRCFGMSPLPDSINCLQVAPEEDLLVAGLKNGNIAFYRCKDVAENALPFKILSWFRSTITDNLSPINCMEVHGNNLLCGLGTHATEISLDTFEVTNKHCLSEHSPISQIDVSGKNIFAAFENTCVVSIWETLKEDEPIANINCHELLTNYYEMDISEDQCNVKCFTMVENNVLWIGSTGGYILLVDLCTNQLISALRRHSSAINAIAQTFTDGKSSEVITAGNGFRQTWNAENEPDELGYVLVWNADLADQKKRLEVEMKRLNESIEEFALPTSNKM